MASPSNRHEFRVFAMKRSGHHAVMAWLIRHFKGPIYFLNNCSFSSSVLFSSTRVGKYTSQAMFGGRVSIFFNEGKLLTQIEHLRKDELLDDPLLRIQKLIQSEVKALTEFPLPLERDAYLFNLEDFNLNHLAMVPIENTARGQSEHIHNVIVLRDPYNWLASRFQGQFPINDEILSAWKSQCREALGRTSGLDSPAVINYDRWFARAEYRQQLTDELNLGGTEPGIGEMTNFGGGSSFSGMEFRTSAEKMDVLNRWKVFEHNQDFQALFEGQQELIELADEVFPEVPRPGFLR